MSPSSSRSGQWRPTHRAMLYSVATRTVQSVLVMLTEDGHAFTRHEWLRGLEPSLQRDSLGRWWIDPAGPLAAVSTGLTFKIVALDTPTQVGVAAA